MDAGALEKKVILHLVELKDFLTAGWEVQAHLSRAEQERADRFRFPEDRDRFLLGRTLLRQCLTAYRGEPAGGLELAYTPRGKPYLAADPDFHFSISHAGEWVGIAVVLHTQVGLDVEALRRKVDLEGLGQRILSAAEWAEFQELDAAEKPQAFFHAWTAKEARLKATGVGISEGLRDVEAGLSERGSHERRVKQTSSRDWCFQALPLPAGYVGHVVWDDATKEVEIRPFMPGLK